MLFFMHRRFFWSLLVPLGIIFLLMIMLHSHFLFLGGFLFFLAMFFLSSRFGGAMAGARHEWHQRSAHTGHYDTADYERDKIRPTQYYTPASAERQNPERDTMSPTQYYTPRQSSELPHAEYPQAREMPPMEQE
ncbi:MAG TPA: hypothetical protein VH593_01255 [Ktedonobacteraceae bacterium]